MDPLTHALAGATLVSASFTQKLDRKAILIGALGGISPDLDFLTYFFKDPLAFLSIHRQMTHSFIFAPALAFLLFLCFLPFRFARQNSRDVYIAFLVAILSHIFLDVCTPYGTEIYWPFLTERVALDTMAQIDPLLMLILMFSLFWTYRHISANPSVYALLFMIGYFFLAGWQHTQALSAQARLIKSRGDSAAKVRVFPALGNLWVYRSLYVSAANHLTADMIRMPPFGKAHTRAGGQAKLVEPGYLPNVGLSQKISKYHRLTDGFVGFQTQNILGDLRFSDTPEGVNPLFGLQLNYDNSENTLQFWYKFPTDVQTKLANFWKDLTQTQHLRPIPEKVTL